MPRPRFERLKKEKRERILETAAKAFAVAGFEQASMNQILDEAGISKGAAYYYFDDKADLYVTTVHHYLTTLVNTLDLSVDALTAENYWPRTEEIYLSQFRNNYDQPWVFGVIRSTAHVSPDVLSSSDLAGYITYFQDAITALVQVGQELGLVRTDLPQSLLTRLFMAVDETADQWFMANWDSLTAQQIETTAAQVFDSLKRLLIEKK
ncbi:MAG: TetR/AcrR family transcriptional regulator [Candidatus Promineifilaceae bacterium]